MSKTIYLKYLLILVALLLVRGWFIPAPTINTTAFARVSTQPSKAIITAAFTQSGSQSGAAFREGKDRVTKIAELVQGLGVSEIRLTNDQVLPGTANGYQYVAGLQVTLNEVAKLPEITQLLTDQNLNVTSIRYVVNEDQKAALQNQLFEQALAKAKTEVNASLDSVNQKAGALKAASIEASNIDSGSQVNGPFTDARVDFTNPTVEYQASYRLVFELKPWYIFW